VHRIIRPSGDVVSAGDGFAALASAADSYLRQWFPQRPALATFAAGLSVRLDSGYCREVAEYYDRAPKLAMDASLHQRYERLKQENTRQYRALLDAGLRVVPWLRPGRPYRCSADLIEKTRTTGTLYVQLTRDAHGPAPDPDYHPLREPAGVTCGGVQLCHNDILRVVHDIVGHVLLGNSSDPRAELLATYGHLQLYPPDLLPVLYTEQVGQICWFYFGPHLLDRAGRLPARGDPGYLPPRHRPYPVQKFFSFPRPYLDRFLASFSGGQQ
jgi:hypothetical protein